MRKKKRSLFEIVRKKAEQLRKQKEKKETEKRKEKARSNVRYQIPDEKRRELLRERVKQYKKK